MAEYVKVAKVGDIVPGEMIGVEVGQKRVVIANVNGQFYAFDAACTHMGGPLDEGFLEGFTLQCPWHAGEFDVRTGAALAPPPHEGVPTYSIRVQGEDLEIEAPA